MTQLSPADIKPHLALPAGDSGDDALISDYIAAAEGAVISHLRRDFPAEDFPTGWPPAVLQAVRLLVGHFYLNREAVSAAPLAAIPYGVAVLLAPWRDLSA